MNPHVYAGRIMAHGADEESEAVDLTYETFDAWRTVNNTWAADAAMDALITSAIANPGDRVDLRLAVMLSALTATLDWGNDKYRELLIYAVRKLAAGRTGLDSADALLQGLTKKVQR